MTANLSAVAIPGNGQFRECMMKGLVWLPEHGMGFSGSALRAPSIYDGSYWDEYERRDATPMGELLTRLRVHLVTRHVGNHTVCDVGIGAGAFLKARGGETYGYDVNPVGIAWLKERAKWLDPYAEKVHSVTFWDVLEHIHDPTPLLANVAAYVFVSIPIFRDADHVIRSKHYKPNEHIWYWTRDGLIQFMRAEGFDCLEHSTPESLAGREDIHTFVFRRCRA